MVVRPAAVFLITVGMTSITVPKCNAEAMREIDNASAEVRQILEGSNANAGTLSAPNAKLSPDVVDRMQKALDRGEKVNADLKEQVKLLEAERTQLVQVQSTLASGLIGAVVTAIVAIGGAILSAKNSKPERDLKRLNVIEKARDLQQAGVSVPRDIESSYLIGPIKAKSST